MFLKILITGLILALGEVINGNIRVRVLQRKFGKKRAKNLSFFSGVALIFTICWFALPWISPKDYPECFMVGFVWFSIMLCMDIYFGKYVFKLKWDKIVDDFNPIKGNLLGIGMILLFFSPVIVFMFQQ